MTCASCGEANPARARFCAACGSPLAAGRRRGVRKVVTVVVCDVTGSTALGERLDPESLGLVMARWFDAMRAVVERHHGAVQKFIGDAVVAAFGVPVVREDDALRAVRAAAAMRDAVAAHRLTGAPPWGSPDPSGAGRVAASGAEPGSGLEVRIGVATGEVMVETVQLATKLQAAAGPGQVLLDRRTWRLARDALVVVPTVAGERAAGEARVAAFRLVDVSPDAPARARRHQGPLVGRQAELQLFDLVSGELALRDDLYAQVERRGPLAAVLARRGRQQEAERLAAEAVALARRSDMLTMQANALLGHAGVLRLGGAAEQAAPLLEEALALCDRKGNLVTADRARDLLAHA